MKFSVFLALDAFAFTLFWSFLLCYTATISSDVIGNIGDIVYNGNWPKYPLDYRKYVLFMILRSQRPLYFMGFKMIRCTLENFTNVSPLM